MPASPTGWTTVNLSVGFGKMVERAGFGPWPPVTQNMRANCETDLTQHPIHVVCAWLGSTPTASLTRYLQTQESDGEKALEAPETTVPSPANGGADCGAKPTQPATATSGQEGSSNVSNTAISSETTGHDRPGPLVTGHSDARDRT